MYATRAYAFHGLPSEILDMDPAPVDGVMVHWSNTKPPTVVLEALLSAVRLIPSLLGAMVVFKKYAAPLPQIMSIFPST